MSRFVFKELFSFRSVQRTMCILGFLFFSSTLFLNFFKNILFLAKNSLMRPRLYIYMEFSLKSDNNTHEFNFFRLPKDFLPICNGDRDVLRYDFRPLRIFSHCLTVKSFPKSAGTTHPSRKSSVKICGIAVTVIADNHAHE